MLQMSKAAHQDVIYSKTARFHMFSITKCIKNGWKLSGNSEKGLVIAKGDIEVKFDIKISTKTGVL